MSAPYLQPSREGVILRVHAQPNAKRSQVAGLHGDELKIRLQAPPVEGKANAALVRFLSDLIGVPKSAVEIVRGESSRNKQVLVRGRSVEQLAALNLHARR
jgi:uncharacterized protein (TIGR00251 family)